MLLLKGSPWPLSGERTEGRRARGTGTSEQALWSGWQRLGKGWGRKWPELSNWGLHLSDRHQDLASVKSSELLLKKWEWKVLSVSASLQSPGILQTVAMKWLDVPFSRGSSQPRDWTQVSLFVGRFFTSWANREAQEYWSGLPFHSPGDFPT